MIIVFTGKYIEKEDDFYLEEVPNMTIGKSYEVHQEDQHMSEKIITDFAFKNIKWSVTLILKNDIGSYITIQSKHFCTLEDWRDFRINNILYK